MKSNHLLQTFLPLLAGALVAAQAPPNDCTCTLLPLGRARDDAPAIGEILSTCGNNGSTVCFPAPYTYTIGSALETFVENATIRLEGTFQFTPNISYWINNSFPIELQDQRSAWRFHGQNFVLDGGENFTGMIDGNGQAWYTYSKGGSNTHGRPMPLDVYNSTNGVIRNLYFYQPQFWAMIIQGSKNITVENVEVLGENTDPSANGTNWVQNTDGADTWRSSDITFRNFTYNGGDDCVAFKGNSSDVKLTNITCLGGPGIAFGSIGQYPGQPDYLDNITIENLFYQRGVDLGQGTGAAVYLKSWIGVPLGTPPNGGGGGTGAVSNVRVSNVTVVDADLALYITSCLSYVNSDDPTADPDKYCNTSTLTYNNISFSGFSGTTFGKYGDEVAQLNCSTEAPCTNLFFTDFDVSPPNGAAEIACQNVKSIQGVECN